MKLLSHDEIVQLKDLVKKGDKEAISKLFYYALSTTMLLEKTQNRVAILHKQLGPKK